MSSMNTGKSGRSIAITTRLVVSYLLTMLVILFLTNWFQFRALSDDLEFEDNDFLVERITTFRSMMARHPDNLAYLQERVQQSDENEHIRHLVRIRDKEGRIFVESPGMASLPVSAFPPPASVGGKISRAINFLGPDNRHYLLNSAWAAGVGDPEYRQVQVALDVSEEVGMMAKYQLKMGISILVGLLFAGGLVVLLTKKGLRPLQEIASTVARISETDLHQRVRTGTWPRELDQLTVALDGMLERLEDSFARLSEFSANLAHELRTPINNLRGEAEVALSRSRTTDEYRRIIESSIEEHERLSRMVGDVLFLARPDQGFAPHLIDARAEIEKLVEYYQAPAEEQRVVISIEGAGTVTADPRLFQRAVGNLISNALHYTPPAGHVVLKIVPGPQQMEISVQDDGIGVSPAELPSVFDRFYRGAEARSRYNQGSGLGLAIVRSIMSLHGGSATISSTPGNGTSVILTFPVSTCGC